MIPKVFHRIWFGGKPMPDVFVEWGKSWLHHHPGWSMKLWTEKDLDGFQNADLIYKCSNLAQESDVVRYEVLFKEGGVYIDTDFECLKNIEPLIDGLDFFAHYQQEGVLSNAIFGGTAGHEIFSDLVRETRPAFKPLPWNAMGPAFFTSVVSRHPKAKIFERKTFTPYTWHEYYYSFYPDWPAKNVNPAGSYAINHRASIWHGDSKNIIRSEV